jgi:DNA processing protein
LDWSLVARQAQLEGGVDGLWSQHLTEQSAAARAAAPILRAGLQDPDALMDRVAAEVEAAHAVGARLVTVLDADYPANLRLIPNLPPFLFYRGDLAPDDSRSVAVVGSRGASEKGLARADRMARLLVAEGVTVTSGLARGIDTAAHRAALDAGGRTIAVLGTGITRCYPPENEALAEAIAGHGALVSQFWPTRGPGRDTFPRRNIVTSGISQGTVVVEAAANSGAKMQARLALEHGKKVFLLASLVAEQTWARNYLARGAIEVADVADVLRHLAAPERVRQAGAQRQQLSLTLL